MSCCQEKTTAAAASCIACESHLPGDRLRSCPCSAGVDMVEWSADGRFLATRNGRLDWTQSLMEGLNVYFLFLICSLTSWETYVPRPFITFLGVALAA